MYLVITTVCVTPLHPPPPNSQYPESTFFTFLIEIAEKRTDNLTVVFTTPCTSMKKSSHSSESLEDIVREENIVDYDSDTVVEEGKPLTCHVSVVRTFSHSAKPISGTKHGSRSNSVACPNQS